MPAPDLPLLKIALPRIVLACPASSASRTPSPRLFAIRFENLPAERVADALAPMKCPSEPIATTMPTLFDSEALGILSALTPMRLPVTVKF